MNCYYGINVSTGKHYAMSEIPEVTQWGDTEQEAQEKLKAYLETHHGMTVVNWRPFPRPTGK